MPRPAPSPTHAIAYLRCSTDRQDLSPDAQRAAIEAWAAREGVDVCAWHEDRAVSGGAELEDRPGLTAAVADLPVQGAGLLVVAKRDRLARDVLTAALVERLAERVGARVVSADGTGNGDGPEAQLLRGIVDLFAQYERMIIKARTRAALAVKKARGERVGGVPYGWRVGEDGRLIEHAAEQRVAARARALRVEGLSLRRIAARFDADGLRPRTGRQWHVQVLARLVVDPSQGLKHILPPS